MSDISDTYSLYFCYIQGRHVLVYDIGTENESWELVDLKEVSFIILYKKYKVLDAIIFAFVFSSGFSVTTI